ncbi:MAG TPA: CehA/McbA family metallohydrolase [Planctomycetaceae bacterium]|nr:CehA/McbA family metallohydrolase [Planctomycetaceae bacterium]
MLNRPLLACVLTVIPLLSVFAADPLPLVERVEHQPLVEAAKRLQSALEYVGAPLQPADARALKAALENENASKSIAEIQNVLDKYCLAEVNVNPESRVKVAAGAAKKELMQQGWRSFLIKVHNEAGVTAPLVALSENAAPLYERGRGARQAPLRDDPNLVRPNQINTRFLDIEMYNKQPLRQELSGLELEYRIIQLYSRDAGKREATLAFNVGQGTQDLGFRSEIPILFECAPAVQVQLGIEDIDGSPAMASLVIRDAQGRVYPAPARRLAPDFFFHNQIYREDGETVTLPPGEYKFEVTRGPEYLTVAKNVSIPGDATSHREEFKLERWIHSAKRNWFSGDHHVHAAGCAHYDAPTEGVTPADMMRHILGEDLNVGCVLSWGPCWYSQKQYFEGKVSELSTPANLMRYDVEVSGFPSSHAGHLCLLRLTEDDYPGTTLIEEWPSWTLPVLKWGSEQNGVVGYSHSGWGLTLPDYGPNGERIPINRRQPNAPRGRAADKLPDYALPPFDGIGANEYIVTVAHDVCDFISSVDTPAIWELNIWYHTLNCGMKARISGETDFPCIYGDKVGLGRIYVKLDDPGDLDFDTWVQGLKNGRSYCGDGLSHIFDFKVNDVALGEPGSDGKISQLDLPQPGKVNVTFDVAALLAENPTPDEKSIRGRRLDEKPYWHIERSRIEDTRKVPVEVIVNGEVAASKEIDADGTTRSLEFEIEMPHSGWVAVRILPSVHTNPIFVEVEGKPIRASRRSAEWCAKAVDICWNSKRNLIRESERAEAKAAYDKAREIYQQRLAESVAD